MKDPELAAQLQKVEAYVTAMYKLPAQPHFPYHNLQHTVSVVNYCKVIIRYYPLTAQDEFIVLTAAWFHDIGHLYNILHGHEQKGVEVMEAFCSEQALSRQIITAISDCILATQFPANPKTLCESILCDADTYHLGTPLFRETDSLVRVEMEQRLGKKIDGWLTKSLQLLTTHRFFTGYCQRLLESGKQENIAWLQSRLHSNT